MNKVLVIATHPDDETLGCGGALLRHMQNKDKMFWLIMTKMSDKKIWNKKSIILRDKKLNQCLKHINLKKFIILDLKQLS